MAKIVVNNRVRDNYLSGMSLNDAIATEFKDEIDARIKEKPEFKDFTPLNFVMFDAKLNKYSKIEDIVNASTAYTSGGTESNDWLFPAWVDSTLHEAIYESDIIQYIVNTTIGVDSNIVRSAMLDLTSEKNRNSIKRARVAEAADLPLAKITIGEKAITLWKHGRAIETTYEATRRMTIPMWQRHMAAIVADLAHQNLEAAVDVLMNGDGNNNAATEVTGVTATGGLTADALIDAMIEYWAVNHYTADTIVAGKDDFKKLVKMTFDNSQVPGASAKLSFNIPQIGAQNVTVLMANNMQIGGSNVITLSNRANSLIRYTENGSNIQEAQAFIRNQTNLLTFSENSGYAIGTAGSNMYVKTGA